MRSRGPIGSLEEGRAAQREESYSEEAEPLFEEIRDLEQRLNLYGASNWEAALPVLRYWREHFRTRMEDGKDADDRLFMQGACFAIRSMQEGKQELQKELAQKQTEVNELRERYELPL